MPFGRVGQLTYERHTHVPLAEVRRHKVPGVYGGEYGRGGIHIVKHVQYPFSPAILVDVVVDKGYLHIGRVSWKPLQLSAMHSGRPLRLCPPTDNLRMFFSRNAL